jgi:hypothetical protein
MSFSGSLDLVTTAGEPVSIAPRFPPFRLRVALLPKLGTRQD